MSEPSVSSIAIYQLRSAVQRESVGVAATARGQHNQYQLHEILQSAFGWSGEHLHRFLIPDLTKIRFSGNRESQV
jgi:hypothetical protein